MSWDWGWIIKLLILGVGPVIVEIPSESPGEALERMKGNHSTNGQ